MRWYLDEDGFPKRGLTTKSEMDSLLKNLESIKDWTPSEAEDFDDVFDETLLPLPIQRSNEIKQSQENYATDQTKLNPMSESNEDFQGETKLLDTPVIHYYRLLYSPDLIAQKLKDAADTLAQASLEVPEELKIGPTQPMNIVSEETNCPLGSEQDSKPRSRKRQGSARKEDSSKKQVTDAKKVEAASLKWLPKEK
ncbi:hypothetical protein LINGRAHAP2_LOCUS36895 [Linum grandiflorum]